MSGRVTTGESLITERTDITTKPRRYQHEILADMAAEAEAKPSSPKQPPMRNVTIEKAIHWYSENAAGDHAELYRQTVKWLKELRTMSKTKGGGEDVLE